MQEKELVLDIGRRLRDGLVRAGFKVAMTRDSDSFISLQERTSVASRPGTDLFVSIHANANKSRGARGVEVYYSAPLNAKDAGEAQHLLNVRTLCEKLNMRAGVGDLRDIVADMLYAHKQAISAGLADAVTRGFSDDTGARTRGSKPERFFVLRNTLVPAVLVEIGFITNPREARLLKDDAYRTKVAAAIVKSLTEFLYASGI
jgi:N-acetylmuramoyl-L-alanine amidase